VAVGAREVQSVLDHARNTDALDNGTGLLAGDVRVLFGDVPLSGVYLRSRGPVKKETIKEPVDTSRLPSPTFHRWRNLFGA
jgi:hypothetical protein